MISVTHFETLYSGKKLSCQSIIRYPEKRHIHIYLLQRKSSTSLSAAIRASPAVCSVRDLAKNKFTSTLSYGIYTFANPPIKLKLGQQIGGGTTNSKPLGPIRMMSQYKTLSIIQIVFITLFSAIACCCYAFSTHRKVCDYGELKPFSAKYAIMVS
jgi:hypothetical protein